MVEFNWVKISKIFMITGLIICFIALALKGFNVVELFNHEGHHEWYRIMVIG